MVVSAEKKALWIFPKYTRKGASSRLRLYQFVPHLEQAGFVVHVKPLFNDTYLDSLYGDKKVSALLIMRLYLTRIRALRSIANDELVLIQGELFPWLPAFFERLFLRSKRYIVDYDDAVFHRYDLSRFALIRAVLGQKIDRLMARAELVIVGNDYLAERAIKAGARKIEWLPTVIDADRYSLAEFHTQPASLRVGWIGTPVTWATYGEGLFTMLSEQFSDQPIEFLAIGAASEEQHNGNLRLKPWSEATEVGEIASLTVGVMPLEDTLWARGKCGYKLIQYLACGVPVVASPVGTNREIVTDDENGYFAATPEQWQSSISKLVSSLDERRRMGLRGRENVLHSYSLQSVAPRLTQMLNQVADSID